MGLMWVELKNPLKEGQGALTLQGVGSWRTPQRDGGSLLGIPRKACHSWVKRWRMHKPIANSKFLQLTPFPALILNKFMLMTSMWYGKKCKLNKHASFASISLQFFLVNNASGRSRSLITALCGLNYPKKQFYPTGWMHLGVSSICSLRLVSLSFYSHISPVRYYFFTYLT